MFAPDEAALMHLAKVHERPPGGVADGPSDGGRIAIAPVPNARNTSSVHSVFTVPPSFFLYEGVSYDRA